MRNIFFAFLLLLPFYANAQTAGPGCEFTWDYADPLPANVDGFKFYLDGVETWTGAVKTVSCAAIGLDVAGTYNAYVTAYNDAGQSAASNTLTFEYVTGAPSDAPTLLRFLN